MLCAVIARLRKRRINVYYKSFSLERGENLFILSRSGIIKYNYLKHKNFIITIKLPFNLAKKKTFIKNISRPVPDCEIGRQNQATSRMFFG